MKDSIQKFKNINYSLKELLINCGKEEIQGLIYYFNKESKKKDDESNEELKEKEKNIEEKALEENIYNKIYKILPQDIISILPENNIIKKKYFEFKKIYNYKDYIEEEENQRYKISIIYTYTSIVNTFEGLIKGMSFMILEIKSEDGLKNIIDEIKIKNENNKLKKEEIICIHFEKSNSEKIKFVSNFILNNFKDDKYNYIIIIHININFNAKNHERIYSLPDINPDINQIFIDNLNGNNMNLDDLLTKDIKYILEENKDVIKLNEEFNKTLIYFIKSFEDLEGRFLNENSKKDYINELQNYLDEEESIKEAIIQLTYKLIENNKEEEVNCKNIIEKMYNNNYINIYTIDIISCLIEYIKENIFNKFLKIVFEILEDNNILTTLLEIKKSNYKFITKDIVEDVIKKYLDEIIIEKNCVCKPKFLYNYNVPGCYNYYKKINDYINKNISLNYSYNEKKLRLLIKPDIDKINDFHNTEKFLLKNLYKEIEINQKMFIYIINRIPNDIIFNDYVIYYLQKYKNPNDIYKKDDIYHKLIELLLKIRFNNENQIIKDNNEINFLLLKIIWLESNINHILNIFNIFENAKALYNYDENTLFKEIDELIKGNSIKYIINERKTPEHTKEVNECYYILLASLCYIITTDKIQLIELIENKKSNDLKIEINDYYNILIKINKILQKLNDDLFIFLNEMYIIDELIKIIELLKFNNIEKINEIKNLIRENAHIIQKYPNIYNNTYSYKFSEEIKGNFEAIYSLIIKDESIDKDYYDKLRYILFKEIKKIPDINYRYNILEKILESDEMIKKSNDLFQILLKNYIQNDKFEESWNNILLGDDDILKLIEKKLNNDNFVLAQSLLYFFEKNSLIYLKNILGSKDKNNKVVNIEDKPLTIFKDCIVFLYYYIYLTAQNKLILKEIYKLFCIAYIKVFSYTFIKILNVDKNKYNNKPEEIIEVINGNISYEKENQEKKETKEIKERIKKLGLVENIIKNRKDSLEDYSLFSMIRFYIYKILYNNYKIDVFIIQESINKYKLKDYKDYSKLIENNKELLNIYQMDDKVKTLNSDNYDYASRLIKEYKNEEFKSKNKLKDFNIEDIGIDNFYVISYNLVLSNLQLENPDIQKDFYINICEPLFQEDQLLFEAIQLFYNPTKYKEIKKNFSVNSDNIIALLFGYRFCLNEIASKNKEGIYYPLYFSKDLNYLKKQFYPGNDTKPNKIYYEIINHFKFKPNEGCYVCLCKKGGYYHSVPSGFPGESELNMKCPNCSNYIGSYQTFFSYIEPVNKENDNYYRIIKNDKEIEEIKKNQKKRNLLKKIKYLTLKEYKEKYIYISIKNEKGIYKTDENSFKSDEKIVRNLSQISYRLLNYILYAHLFFARLITKKNEFDQYLPKKLTLKK